MSDIAANKKAIAVINSVLSGESPVDALDQVMAADFKDNAAFPGQRPGRDGFKDAVANLRAAFDQTVRSLHTVAEGHLVIDHWVSEGKHRGACFGIEPTGKCFECRCAAFFIFEGEALVCERVYFDAATIAGQLLG